MAPAAGQVGSSGSGEGGVGGICVQAEVTPQLTWNWSTPDPADAATPGFVVGPELSGGLSGRGSLDMTTATPDREVVDYFHPADNTPLARVAEAQFPLSYKFAGDGSFGPTYQLRLFGMNRLDNQADGFTTLLWAPEKNGGFAANTWTEKTGLSTGNWISTAAINGQPDQTVSRSLAAILADNPSGYVIEYGVLFGSSDGGIIQPAWVDTLEFGCNGWNFEPGLPPLPPLSGGSVGSVGSAGSGLSGGSVGSS
ncbi:hypothetical protein OG921_23340 [Aldersonia sp. NBC_00410]|uniref:hypothetical protein n=1 Tax=Aldersonia sp. NBC_00410 TaxID=2975954 RepID=UPI00224E0805|nr:hypothetical protein [Aldersonia sp. NBC_00410]MCX5046109.1 hypothetical protein [Aldersonia sp. NBC_00410]